MSTTPAAAPTDLSVEAITAALPADTTLGTEVRYYPVAVSADSLAQGWARQQNAPEGALVVADLELTPRGRRGVAWTSIAGRALTFAVVLRPELPPHGEGLFWLLASLAAAEGISDVTGADVRLKWPNDLVLDGRRLGAVKIDVQLGPGVIESAVIGIRINVGFAADEFPADVRDDVTSLAMAGLSTDRLALLVAVLKRIAARYEAGVAVLLDAYRDRCDTLGTRVNAHLMPTGLATGRALDVDERGGLILETASAKGAIGVDALLKLEPA